MSKIFEGIYLFSDVDGTLATTSGHIPERNIEAINHFVENGGTFGVATGRYLGDIELLEQVDINGLCILNNGACVFDYTKQKLASTSLLPDNIIGTFVEYLKDNKDIGLLIVNDDGYITVKVDDNNRPALDDSYPTKDLSEVKTPYYKILFVINNNMYDKIAELRGLRIDGIDFVQSGRNTLEVTPRDISKGKTFLQICKDFSIDKDKTYFIGDSYNDVSIMRVVGHSACVADSPYDIKDIVDTVVGEFNSGAVADFIEIIEKELKGL